MFFAPKNELKNPKKFFTLDVETYSLSATCKNFWYGCIYGENYRSTFYSIEDFLKIIEHKRFKHSLIFAHNGGGFDYLVLFGNLLQKGAVYVGSRFIYMEYKTVMFADSMNFFKTSLAKIGDLIGIPKTELENKGNIERGKKPTETEINYCLNDCRIIFVALKMIFENKRPCLTIGSLALQIFQRDFLKEKIKFNPDIEKKYIQCYYGGRTEAFKLGAVDCEVYDINSMYPYAMKNVRLPHPSYSFIKENPTLKNALRYISEKEGMIEGTIKIPSGLKFMPLPYMTDKLIFPTGIISGAWCINEIRYALTLGCELLDVKTLIGSSRVLYGKDFFGDFIDVNYKKKETTKGIEREFYKLILNNLFGKMGQHNFESVVYFPEIEQAVEYIKKQPEYHRFTINRFNKKRNDCTVNSTTDKLTKHSLISIAAYITAYSRVLLHKYLMEFNPIYCDTDSLFIPVEQYPKPPTSDKLGALKLENYRIVNIAGCKSYTKITGDKIETKIKGIPKKADKIGLNEYAFTNIIKPKSALRRNIPIGELIKMTRNVSNIYTKGKTSFGTVRPFIISNGEIQNPNYLKKKVREKSLKFKIINENPINLEHLILLYMYSGGRIGKKEFKHTLGHLDVNRRYLIEKYPFDRLMENIEDFDNEFILNAYKNDLNEFATDICDILMKYPTKVHVFKKLKEYYLKINDKKENKKQIEYINLAPF